MLLLLNTHISAYLICFSRFMEVVLHDGVIREKPSTPEEARKFIKGLCYFVEELELFNNLLYLTCPCPVVLDDTFCFQGTLKAMLRRLDLCLLQM
jgi:hypothetical protein